jgi:hypothetical protein
MPNTEHEVACAEISTLIQAQLGQIKNQYPDLAPTIEEIRQKLASTVIAGDEFRCQADNYFSYNSDKYPGLVIEVGKSQGWGGSTGLQAKAIKWLDLGVGIHTVLVLDMRNPTNVSPAGKIPYFGVFRAYHDRKGKDGMVKIEGTKNTCVALKKVEIERGATPFNLEIKLWELGSYMGLYWDLNPEYRQLSLKIKLDDLLKAVRWARTNSDVVRREEGLLDFEESEARLEANVNKP